MRTIIRIVAAAAAATGVWLIAWPAVGPYITPYIPRFGDNRVAVTGVAPAIRGGWTVTVSYYYNNRPPNARIALKLLGDQGKVYPIAGGFPVAGGENVTRLRIDRPNVKEAVKGTRVVAELLAPGQPQPIAAGTLQAKVEWADMESYAMGLEMTDHSPDEIVARATALAHEGNLISFLRAKALLETLLERYPHQPGAVAELVNLQSEAIWSEPNLRKMRAYGQLHDAVNSLMNANAYEELDGMEDTLRRTRMPDVNGTAMLHTYYDALIEFEALQGVARPEELAGSEKFYRAWIEKRPQSVAARVALVDLYSMVLRRIRDSSAPATAATDAEVRILLQKAADQLRACDSAQCRDDPEWHYGALHLLCTTRAPRATFGSVFEQAYERFPDYLPIQQAAACYMLGTSADPRDFSGIVEEFAAKAPKDFADAVYTRAVTDSLGGFGSAFNMPTPAQMGIDCRRLVHGHDEWLAKYPSPLNWNLAAAAAAQCHEKEATRRFLAQVKEPMLDVWGPDTDAASRAFARVKSWAGS